MGVLRPRYSPSDQPARLSGRALQEIAREILRMQRSVPHSRDRGRRGDVGQLEGTLVPVFPGLYTATVTTAITACSSSGTPVPGTGAAQLWYYDDDADVMRQNGDDGMGTTFNGIVTVRNWYVNSGTIAVATHVLVYPFSNAYWLAGADC